MFYLLLRIIITILYVGGIILIAYNIIDLYLALLIYLLVFIIHIVHLKKFAKEVNETLPSKLRTDILIFGMIPIWEWKKINS